MSIKTQEENLFEEWKKQKDCSPFVKDGVVNDAAYKASNRKVVFILKEYPAWEDCDYDLRCGELVCPYKHWKKVADILRGINIAHNSSANNDGVPDKMPDNICAFNLMKKRGGRETDWTELKTVAKRDRDFIRRQFEIYDPDLAFCMGFDGQQGGDMLDVFREVMGHEDIPKQHTQPDEWGWYERSPGKIVVNTYHMAARGRAWQSADDVLAIVDLIDNSRQS